MLFLRKPLSKNTLTSGFLMLSVAACAASHDASVGVPNGSPDKPETTAEPTYLQGIQKMNKQQQIAHCKRDMAEKLQIDESEITVASVQAVTWRSGAMGCPKPGMMYTQALVPGMLIMLNAGDQSYRYHASTDGEPSYCPNQRAESPAASEADI